MHITPWMEATIFILLMAVWVATAVVTLLGIAGKLRVQARWLAILVPAVLVEGAVGVYGLLKPRPEDDLIKSLPQEVRGVGLDSTKLRIQFVFDSLREANESSRDSIIQLQEDLDGARRHYLVRLIEFHHKASEFGNSLNFTYPRSEQKAKLAEEFLALLSEIGQYAGSVIADPDTATVALAAYQKSRGFQELGWYSEPVFNAMLSDHVGRGLRTVQ